MLQIIYVNFNNVKDKIDEVVGQDPGNHSDDNGSSDNKCPEFVSFFDNNRSGYFK